MFSTQTTPDCGARQSPAVAPQACESEEVLPALRVSLLLHSPSLERRSPNPKKGAAWGPVKPHRVWATSTLLKASAAIKVTLSGGELLYS